MKKKKSSVPENISRRIVIIRHGEKPSVGNNLCPKGLNRALELPDVLKKLIGVPDYCFVPEIKTGNSTSAVRMFQTITPFAVKYNLDVNSSFKDSEGEKAAESAKRKSGLILMVWDHTHIPSIAAQLGVPGKLKWDKDDFDSIWIIDFAKGNSKPVMTVEQQNLKPKGSC